MSKDFLDIVRKSNFDRNALIRQADQTGLGRTVVEKDFVISAVLLLISELPEFSEYSHKMAFRGGTCIKKVYFPDETRFSEDLDFTNLTLEESMSFLAEVKGLIGRNLGVTTFERTEVEYQNERGLDFTLYYTSILQQRNHISFNLSTATPFEDPKRMKVTVSPYFKESPKLPTMSLSEIVAEKMRALLQRKKPRDVFDIWFLICKKGVRLNENILRKKLQRSYDAAPFGKRKEAEIYVMNEVIYTIKHSVTEKSWSNELGGLIMRPRPDRRVVIQRVCEILREMSDISLKAS
jgi:predicted nucleotidyltransferase component of viral defense system